MKISDFSFNLPEELIAQEPATTRGTSRLMVLDRTTGSRHHSTVSDIRDYIPSGSVMIFNNSRVRKARLYGTTQGGGNQEFLLVRRIAGNRWLAIGTHSRKLKPGRSFGFPDGVDGTITEVREPYREILFSRNVDDRWLERFGHVPLPPYIHRGDTPMDHERYQTVYARMVGSVAAPTAGLHFTPEILRSLRDHGVTIEFVTLHVGIGTFLPIRSEVVEEHHMHDEEYHVSPTVGSLVTEARERDRPVIAVGTTAVRTLESAWDRQKGVLHSGHGHTDLFIYPGYTFQVVQHLFTNFHTPESSLMVLVSAFADVDTIRRSYQEAVQMQYRFFSYGDAMLIL
jgi:S-adenosylmethionine:tRNA ribosyltransferase-isomerase